MTRGGRGAPGHDESSDQSRYGGESFQLGQVPGGDQRHAGPWGFVGGTLPGREIGQPRERELGPKKK
jgi:hypothetical protein